MEFSSAERNGQSVIATPCLLPGEGQSTRKEPFCAACSKNGFVFKGDTGEKNQSLTVSCGLQMQNLFTPERQFSSWTKLRLI